MAYLLNIPLSCKSGVSSASKKKYSSRGGLGKKIFSGGFYCPGVMEMGHNGDDG